MTEVSDSARSATPEPEPAQAPLPKAKAGRGGSGAAFAVQRYGVAILLALVIVAFSLMLPGTFPTLSNFQLLAGNQSVTAIVTLAAIIPLICGHFDLSIGNNLVVSSIATASMMSHDQPLWLAAVVGIGISTLIGLLNGVLVAKVGVNALITTLGIGLVLGGLTTKYTGGQAIISGISESLTGFGSDTWFGLPTMLYVLVVVAVFIWYLLEHTPYGRELHAVGANPLAARLVGIRVDRVVILSFVITGAMTGFAGVLELARLGNGNPGIAMAFTFPALASAFLGATTIHPGRFNVAGTILAVFFLAISVSGLNLSGVDSWVEDVFNGIALVFAVSLSTVLGRRLSGV